jgi:hypothetical protein
LLLWDLQSVSGVGSHRSREGGAADRAAPVRIAEKRPLGAELSVAAAARMIRTPVHNRVDNQAIRTTLAIRGRRRSERARDRFS